MTAVLRSNINVNNNNKVKNKASIIINSPKNQRPCMTIHGSVQKPQKPEPPIIFYGVFFLSKMGNTCSDSHADIHVFQLTLHGGSYNAVTILLLWQKLYTILA